MTRNTSIALLVAANLLPVFGVLYWDWDVFSIIFLFWCENVVIGLFGIARTAMSAGVFLGLFFLIHYGGFMLGHLMVIFSIFAESAYERSGHSSQWDYFVSLFDSWTIIAVLGLFISHGWSFAENYVGKKEYKSFGRMAVMGMAYKRMVVTHIALIAGGVLLTRWSEPMIGLLILLGMKIGMDIFFHRREHKNAAMVSQQ